MEIFFVPQNNINDDEIIIDGSDYNHIINVLRYNVNDFVKVRDGFGSEYECTINKINNNNLSLKICSREEIKVEPKYDITLYQGMPKKNKLELIVQKSVELGVKKIVPVNFKRSIPKIDEDKNKKMRQRLLKISEAAAKQSGRAIIPDVTELIDFKDSIEMSKQEDIILVPYELADSKMSNTREVIKSLDSKNKIGIYIGPEGGFDTEEINMLSGENIIKISLGKRILRTETAPVSLLSMIMYELED